MKCRAYGTPILIGNLFHAVNGGATLCRAYGAQERLAEVESAHADWTPTVRWSHRHRMTVVENVGVGVSKSV